MAEYETGAPILRVMGATGMKKSIETGDTMAGKEQLNTAENDVIANV